MDNIEVKLAEGCLKAILEKYADPIVKKLGKRFRDDWERFKIDFDIVFRDYLRNSYQKYSKIKTILFKTEPQYIYNFFEVPYIEKKYEARIKADNINAVLDISNFVIIEGTGGIGKSTLLKHFFISALENKDLIPIFLELKDINNYSESYEIADYLYGRLESLNCKLNREYFDYALESGCFVFLLDGYDEILTEKRNTFFSKLELFCDKYANNYYIIASRPFSDFVEMQRFTVVTTCPFTKEQAVSCIKKMDFDHDIRERFVSALENSLYEKHESFASNPLLLSIMLLTFENYAEIPEKLHLFYANAFETLYEKHDATKAGYRREIKSKLSFDDFRTVFSYFCFYTYGQGEIVFSRDELTVILKKIRKTTVAFKTDDYIDDLENALCLLYRDGLNYRFAHRSFQEYFSAFFLKERSDENMQQLSLRLIAQDPFRAAGDSVFSMLYDMCEDRFEQNVFLPVLEKHEEIQKDDESLYDFYYRTIVDSIFFDKTIHDGKMRVDLWLSRSNQGDLSEFVFLATRIYQRRKNPSKAQLKKRYAKDMQLYNCLQKTMHYKIGGRIPAAKILSNELLFELFKETWIGELVDTASQLRDILQKKKQKTTLDFESLFD